MYSEEGSEQVVIAAHAVDAPRGKRSAGTETMSLFPCFAGVGEYISATP